MRNRRNLRHVDSSFYVTGWHPGPTPGRFPLSQNRNMVILHGAAVVAAITLGVALGQQKNGDMRAGLSGEKPASAIRCGDITRLDFRNLTIHSGSRTFAFNNGTAANYDSPPESEQDRKPDWRAEIERDTVVQPDPNVSVRFLVIHDSHETGSGWRYFISGYRCSDGELREVFHRDGLSLTIDRLDSNGIHVSSLVGVNPTTGQKIRKWWSYIWDRSRSKYVIRSTSPNR